MGAPGIGKSDIVEEVRQETDADLLVLHPSVEEPTDAKGLPVPDSEGKMAHFLPFTNLQRLITAPKKLIVLLDDFAQACHAVQAAYMQLLLSRSLDGVPISDNVIFVIASNRRHDAAGADSGILSTIVGRVHAVYEATVSADDWRIWAIRHNVDYRVVNYMKQFPQKLTYDAEPADTAPNAQGQKKRARLSLDGEGYPSPRTWAAVSDVLHLMGDEALTVDDLAIVGRATAEEFLGWLPMYGHLPTAEEILKNPAKAKLPEDVGARYAVALMVAHFSDAKSIEKMFTYAARLPLEFQVLFVSAVKGKDVSLLRHPCLAEWVKENFPKII
jgi:hypothetical protein